MERGKRDSRLFQLQLPFWGAVTLSSGFPKKGFRGSGPLQEALWSPSWLCLGPPSPCDSGQEPPH